MGVRIPLSRGAPVALLIIIALVGALGNTLASGAQDSLADDIAAAEAELSAAQAELARTYEKFTTAQQRQQQASKAAADARAKADTARAESEAAAQRVQQLQHKVDEFASASYRQGSTVGSVTAYLGSASPTDMLARASLLNAIGSEQLDVLDGMRKAMNERAAADKEAQAALQRATDNEAAAAQAKSDAEAAHRDAVAQKDNAQGTIDELLARKAALQAQAAQAAAPAPAEAAPAAAPSVGSSGVVLPAQGTLTSTYGIRWGTVHYGIDIANSIGTPILSTMAGEVISSGPASGFGLWVRVRHDNGLITVYGHINESLVSVGQRVGAGQQIATMGNRGESTGPHLHFEVHENGNKIDPLVWLRSHGVSI
ncbi:murein DD-endopeptidase MepM/ murein hydrolase activator NlpD [Saccharomonospora amisosensis]|uniref:Murein DD-endopeptidase MepM/ murein hydrolase activator NlpD n=1 Tax=Saccharomonospora amisosensis TaxID=1128677 RepID=A0A7X5ULV7_9PSEU|nr:M23 family metallopeptidase [Saccharomonospora amisosensis]NIJ10395.1 murein DD-endopeptidase MepM/ murein hydrolase activator NlpD [Saccharomonospora amisosensis]